jgi:hypothetical protein
MDDLLATLHRAAQRFEKPPNHAQIGYLANLMSDRGEPASAVLDDHERLNGRDACHAIAARKRDRS